MFEQIFIGEISLCTRDKSLAASLLNEIKTRYGDEARHYHNLVHLDSLTYELLNVKNFLNDWQTMVFSIAYHDIIYDPTRNDNEEQSAELGMQRLTQLGLPDHQQLKCRGQILATKNHVISEDNDTNYFTDADLSILGYPNHVYRNYTRQIRNEYEAYPEHIYAAGRAKVLQHFLAMPEIYKTEYFFNKYEVAARRNIADELNGFHQL